MYSVIILRTDVNNMHENVKLNKFLHATVGNQILTQILHQGPVCVCSFNCVYNAGRQESRTRTTRIE